MIREEIHQLEEQYEKEVAGIVEKTGQLLRSKFGLWVLGAISFVDSAVAFPGPVDPFLAAYIIANRSRAWLGFAVATSASVLGGVMLYLFATFFTDQLLALLSPESTVAFNSIVKHFDQGTFMITFLGAFTPIPYGFVVIAAGVLKGNIFMFILGSLAGRGVRFGVVAYLTHTFGESALEIAKKHLKKISLVAFLAVLAYVAYLLTF
ncbi:MAG: VTT domain-containing protein [Patescibacteria group bacterium]